MKKFLCSLSLFMFACGGPADPSSVTASPSPSVLPSPSPLPTTNIIRLALSARQGGNPVTSVQEDSNFTLEAFPICSSTSTTCPVLNSAVWSVTSAFCIFLSDIHAPQVKATCIGGGVARFVAYSDEYEKSGELQIRINPLE